MNEVLIVGALLVVLVGAVSFYLYSRILFNERKLGLIESLLLDIRMNMDMEEDRRAAGAPFVAGTAPVAATVGESDADAEEEYKNVIEEAITTTDVAQDMPSEEIVSEAAPIFTKDYDSLTREEVALIAEKRGIRVTKRMAKGTIIALLQDADKAAPQQGGTDVPGAPVESSAGGAPLDSMGMEEVI